MKRLREHKADGDVGSIVENAGYTIFAAPADGEEPPAKPADHRRDPGRHSRRQRVRRGDDARPSQHQRVDVPQQHERRVQHGLSTRRRDHRLGRAARAMTSRVVSRNGAGNDLARAVRLSRKCCLMHACPTSSTSMRSASTSRPATSARCCSSWRRSPAQRLGSTRRRSSTSSPSASGWARPASATASPSRTARSRG